MTGFLQSCSWQRISFYQLIYAFNAKHRPYLLAVELDCWKRTQHMHIINKLCIVSVWNVESFPSTPFDSFAIRQNIGCTILFHYFRTSVGLVQYARVPARQCQCQHTGWMQNNQLLSMACIEWSFFFVSVVWPPYKLGYTKFFTGLTVRMGRETQRIDTHKKRRTKQKKSKNVVRSFLCVLSMESVVRWTMLNFVFSVFSNCRYFTYVWQFLIVDFHYIPKLK